MKKIITLFVLPLFIGGVFAFQSVGGNEKLEKFSSKAHASAGGNQAGLTGAPAENNCKKIIWDAPPKIIIDIAIVVRGVRPK